MCILHWLFILMVLCTVTAIAESGKKRRQRRMDRVAVKILNEKNRRYMQLVEGNGAERVFSD